MKESNWFWTGCLHSDSIAAGMCRHHSSQNFDALAVSLLALAFCMTKKHFDEQWVTYMGRGPGRPSSPNVPIAWAGDL